MARRGAIALDRSFEASRQAGRHTQAGQAGTGEGARAKARRGATFSAPSVRARR